MLDRGYARSCIRTSENLPSETVWKIGRGPESGLRKSSKGVEDDSITAFWLQTSTLEKSSAIFQTVSPRTRVHKVATEYVPRSGEAYRSLDSGHGGNPIARSLASLSTS